MHTSSMRRFSIILTSVAASCLPATFAAAQVFNGGGVGVGLNQAANVTGVEADNPRSAIINIIDTALSFLALIAVAMVIIAGFYLVLSFGNEENKEKAKKIIIYTLIGLVVILFSKVIVSLITIWLPSQI